MRKQTTMSGDLTFILDLWEDATAPIIEVRAPDWPELTQYTNALWTLFHVAGDVEQLADTRRVAFRAYRYLTSTPLAPGDDVIELDAVITGCLEFAEGWPLHSGAGPSLALADAADALRSVPSVFRRELECVASRYESGVLVVPRAHLKSHVKAVLADLELNGVDIATKAELRVSGIRYELAVVIGDPAATYASMRVPAADEASRSGWLLTAPQASHVAVLLAAGCQNLDTERCWLLGTGGHPPLRLGNEHGAPISIPPVAHHLTTSRAFATPVLAPALSSGTTALAQPVFFVSGRWTFFSDETPPEPRVLLSGEDGGIDLRHSRLGDLRPGAIVALRVGRGESEEIARRAVERLKSERFTDDMVASAIEACQTLKRLLANRLAEVGTRGVEHELRSKGLSPGYARVLARHPLRSEYIAPGQKGYNAFVEVLGEQCLADQKPLLIRLRHARRMAGHDIRHELEAQLCSDTSWTDDLDAEGYACVDTQRLGAMYLEVVARVFDEDQPVAIASLGRLLDSDGSEHFLGQPC
jgi:hypothetical protein